jgi:hypothetical protein
MGSAYAIRGLLNGLPTRISGPVVCAGRSSAGPHRLHCVCACKSIREDGGERRRRSSPQCRPKVACARCKPSHDMACLWNSLGSRWSTCVEHHWRDYQGCPKSIFQKIIIVTTNICYVYFRPLSLTNISSVMLWARSRAGDRDRHYGL